MGDLRISVGNRTYRAVERACEVCGRSFVVSVYVVRYGRGKTCSVRCRCLKASRMAPPNHFGSRGGVPLVEGRKDPRVTAAHNTLHYAVRSGRVVKPLDCSACGNRRTLEGHHEDYARPLDVVWLCKACHQQLHARMRAVGAVPRGVAS